MRVLLTGGSGGIGNAIAREFKKHGHIVYTPTRSDIDLSKEVKLKFADFDIVVCNAGINPIKPITDISDEEVMRVNYTSHLEMVQQCLPHMIGQGWGRVVNIGSIWIDTAKPGRLAYSASKAALHSLTKFITAEYAVNGVIANTISPGYIMTELTHKNNTPEELGKIRERIPVKRLGLPIEVAKLAYNLTIDNQYIAGQNIIIDGGYSCVTY
jgi:NAD(P)-dependent dehydrogenase (short-subunit alcohol dehydrogenase family)